MHKHSHIDHMGMVESTDNNSVIIRTGTSTTPGFILHNLEQMQPFASYCKVRLEMLS